MFAALLAAVSVAGLTACGDDGPQLTSESEGTYVTVDHLRYQVEISRQLNPTDAEDREYLTGIDPVEATLKPNEVWFGVFVRISNNAKAGRSIPTASTFSIEDTQSKEYEPITAANLIGYEQTSLGPKETFPRGVEVASYAQTQGKLVLFKVTNDTLSNRPLELTITGVSGKPGKVRLDV
jgi:hypothetical protein